MLFRPTYEWLTDTTIDLEYKKYLFLAYLQKVERSFTENKLYPFLADLKRHYRNLRFLRDEKERFRDSFPKELDQVDLRSFRLTYKSKVQDSALMEEVDKIIERLLPDLDHYIEEGKMIRTTVLEHIALEPVGILPLSTSEGYLLISKQFQTRVYRFRSRSIEYPDHSERHRDIITQYITSYHPTRPYDHKRIKQDLIHYYKDLPNPATYVVRTDLEIPHIETLLPIAKQMLKPVISDQQDASEVKDP